MYKAGDLRKFSWGEFRCKGKTQPRHQVGVRVKARWIQLKTSGGIIKVRAGDDLLRLRGQTIRDIAGCDTINHQTSTLDNMEWEIKLKQSKALSVDFGSDGKGYEYLNREGLADQERRSNKGNHLFNITTVDGTQATWWYSTKQYYSVIRRREDSLYGLLICLYGLFISSWT